MIKKPEQHNRTERVPTGISGLDSLIEGGFVPGSTVLLVGGPGTGKTIFCYQYLWHGLQSGEPGLFVSFENPPDKIHAEAQDFGWDFAKHEADGKLSILHVDPNKLAMVQNKYQDITHGIIEEIEHACRKISAKRIVFDSISVFGLFLESRAEFRRRLYELVNSLSRLGATVLFTSEHDTTEDKSGFGTEAYAVDGLITMHYLEIGAMSTRSMLIRKMRRTAHGTEVYPMDISKKGITIKPEQG